MKKTVKETGKKKSESKAKKTIKAKKSISAPDSKKKTGKTKARKETKTAGKRVSKATTKTTAKKAGKKKSITSKAKATIAKVKKAKPVKAKTSKVKSAKQKTTNTLAKKAAEKRKTTKKIKSHAKTVVLKKKKTKLKKSEISRLQAELITEKTRVLNELNNLDDITHTNGDNDIFEVRAYSIHMAENASDIEAVNTALGLRKILLERLVQINDALDRLEQGNYGICLRCSRAINMERLLAKPQAVLCVECRRILEAEKRGIM